jgi:hypothetical protein
VQSKNKGTRILKLSQIRHLLFGIGRTKWFLHNYVSLQNKKFNSEKDIKRCNITYEIINNCKYQNLIVSFYEGMIIENEDYDSSRTNFKFGRTIYCNFDESYYLGYMNGKEKHSKGIYIKNNKIF